MSIRERAEQYSDYIIAQRRFFHQCPELSFQEVETTRGIQRQLEEMGIPVTTFPDYTGLVGLIEGGKPGGTVLLRADIDALPIEEHSGDSFASTNGCMHACGHDCHIAMQLGAAKILMDMRDELHGNVKLLFQAAEEACDGAPYYVEHGVVDDCDAVFGMHIWSSFDAPLLSIESGPRMASCNNFKICVEGTSAHGAAPHQGNDAIVAAAAIVMNLQTLVSRRNDPLNPLVITVGTIKGGQRFNIIPSHVELEGTIRTFARELRGELEQTLPQLVRDTAHALGCEASMSFSGYLNPIINDDDEVTRIVRSAAVSLYGEEGLGHLPNVTVSEDFGYLSEKTPGFYGFIGCRNEAIGAVYPNHSDKFRVDESVLHRGSALYAQFAVDFLREKAGQ